MTVYKLQKTTSIKEFIDKTKIIICCFETIGVYITCVMMLYYLQKQTGTIQPNKTHKILCVFFLKNCRLRRQ